MKMKEKEKEKEKGKGKQSQAPENIADGPQICSHSCAENLETCYTAARKHD
jgi:hypothetical protein